MNIIVNKMTTGVACQNTGRNYILMEKEKKYIDVIEDKIEIHQEEDELYVSLGVNDIS